MKIRSKSIAAGAVLCGVIAVFAVAVAQSRQPGANSHTGHRETYSFTNHLITEKSPYLQQHAHNPVDWYPWGHEAFEKARKDNKPIFLSVGYSTCHWCHVMEHESFENPAAAKFLNDNFVCIKVDREERPDVDTVYMTFVQATTGGGGWPMSVWLAPDLKPFFGGTYYPPEQFTQLLQKIGEAWRTDRDRIIASSDSITRQLRAVVEAPEKPASSRIDKALLDRTFAQIKSSYDLQYGGFGSAPKFPRPVTLNFLLRNYARTGKKESLDMALFTLRKMAEGGIHDQIGGGFHRYSTDAYWHVPHFEKMLYDQAQSVGAYLDAFQITHEPFFADVARDILGYVQRDMTGDQGQFYSAEDADSPLPNSPADHAEGAFYVWRQAEIVAALGEESGAIFSYVYGVDAKGNVENDPRREFSDENVLFKARSVEETAKRLNKSPDEVRRILAESRKLLFAARAKRPRPHLDDKTITAWNGLMISAFARAYEALDERTYLLAAQRSAQFIRSKLYDPKSGILLRRYRDGESAIRGFAADYAFLVQGLLDLYEASFDINDLAWALALQNKQDELFWHSSGKGFFSTTGNDPSVLLRVKEDYDGAEPSPSSVSALNLLRLEAMLDQKGFRALAEQMLSAYGDRLQRMPASMPQMMVALDFALSEPKQVIIAGNIEARETLAMVRLVQERFLPNKILLLADGAGGQAFLNQHLEFIRDMKRTNGDATAFVCENHVCQLPTTNLEVLAKLLSRKTVE